jgi:hypothetical protein
MDGSRGIGGSVNPFKMPTDEEVFILRDEEKRQKALDRERLKYKRVHEKTTWSARIGAASGNSTFDADDVEDHAATMPGADVQLPSIDKRVKDNMTQYITKKRKMGLARMSLATKRQEIKKLDEEAEHAEKRITQMEEQLKETEGKFSAFLEHTELEHKNASNRAETETKAKQEKVQEIKKLSAQIAQIETDKRKNEEQLQQCLEFKSFLDQLASVDWMAKTLIELRQEDARKDIATRLEQKYNDVLAEGLTEAEELERQERKKADLERECERVNSTIAATVNSMDMEDADQLLRAELDRYDPDRVPMFFTEPDQILLKFIEIEEGNLFLITTCQEYEEEIETITSQYKQRKQEMTELAKTRHSQMDAIRKQIQAEQIKMKALQERIERAGDQGPAQDQLKERIAEKVKSIYRTLGLGDDASNVGTLGSLTQIEVKLEEMRLQITSSNMEQAFVSSVMRQRDKDRRQEARQVHLNKQKEARERRSKESLARAQAPVKKRVGKPVMWRSRPLDHKKQEITTAVETNLNDDDEFFA